MSEDDQDFMDQFGKDYDDLLRGGRDSEGSFGWPGGSVPPEPENRTPRQLDEKEVQVVGVYEHQEQGVLPAARDSYFVLLQDIRGRRVLIWIGRFEAYAISVAIEKHSFDRPMTHDLLKNIIDRLGGRVERILIDDLWQEIYYAKVSVVVGDGVIDIDARPSDAVALALRCNAPIFMAEAVLEQAALNEEPGAEP